GSFSALVEMVPISSTEQMPMPYALRRARLTARVSATRISAPRTSGETLDGSASPWPTKPEEPLDGKTVALRTNRFAPESHSESTASTWMPLHLLRRASRSSPVCVTYQLPLMIWSSPALKENWKSLVMDARRSVARREKGAVPLASRIFSRSNLLKFKTDLVSNLESFIKPPMLSNDNIHHTVNFVKWCCPTITQTAIFRVWPRPNSSLFGFLRNSNVSYSA